jgi:hypothetical protein
MTVRPSISTSLRTSARAATPGVAGALLAALLAAPASAQTLRGSRGAVERAYSHALKRGLAFTSSRRDVERRAKAGHLVRLGGSPNYRLKGVALPYALPDTRAMLAHLASRYRRQCREPLVVTSALRPTSVRLPNSVAKSVHPTGLAFDLRAPRGRCRPWLREELLSLERRGLVDATEERRPAHFHVIVYRAP